jgi:hypothetical protein
VQTGKRTLVAGIVLVAALAGAVGMAWSGPTSDPPTAAGYGAGWLARQFTAQGFIPASGGAADYGDTAPAALALAAANAGGTQVANAVTYLKAHVDEDVKDSHGNDLPGRLGLLLMLAAVHGDDAHNFGGQDLVARLQATRQTTGADTGFFGPSASGAAMFDGTLRQSLSLLGLAAAKVTPDASSVQWLTGQQCPDGGWQAYRSDTTKPCDATDLTNFAGEDTNSTALAVEALVALKTLPAHDAGAFLDSTQNGDGGFGVFKGSDTDANSTGLVLQAIVAGGENPTTGRWAAGAANPDTALLALQLGCSSPEADRGSFAFQPASADYVSRLLATIQAVPGAAGAPFPLSQSNPSTATPQVACASTTTTTSSTVPSTSTTVAPGGGVTTTTTTPVQAVKGVTLPETGAASTHDLVRLALGLIGAGLALAVIGRPKPRWSHLVQGGA